MISKLIRTLTRPLLRLICGTRLLKHRRGKEFSRAYMSDGMRVIVTYECKRCGATWTRMMKVK